MTVLRGIGGVAAVLLRFDDEHVARAWVRPAMRGTQVLDRRVTPLFAFQASFFGDGRPPCRARSYRTKPALDRTYGYLPALATSRRFAARAYVPDGGRLAACAGGWSCGRSLGSQLHLRDLVLGRAVPSAAVLDRVRDAPSQAINQLREPGHRFQRAGLAPTRDIGDRLARHVQASPAEHNQGGRFMQWVERFALCPRAGSSACARE